MSYTKYYTDNLISAIQELEEISGPGTREEYITVLTAVKLDIEKRIQTATEEIGRAHV